MNSKQLLQKFDIDNLDTYEFMIYEDFSKRFSKVDALQIIINNVENDYTQLSESLKFIAELQETENELNNQQN